MTDNKNTPTPTDDTLCDHCAHQSECNEHHFMCVNFEVKKESDQTTSES